jgi:hypothetical protein
VLKGSEALALALSASGLPSLYSAPHTPLRRVERLYARSNEECHQALSDNLAVSLALGGALLSGHPTCALLGQAGVGGSMEALSAAALLSEYRSGCVLIEGADARTGLCDNRAALQGTASLPILEAGSAEEIYQLARLGFLASEAGGLPMVLRTGARALEDRGDVREGLLSARQGDPADTRSAAEGPLTFCRDDAPYLCNAAAHPFHSERRERRLKTLGQVAAALASIGLSGPARRGVVLAGHLGPRAQALATARGLPTLRLGMAWPLPEPLLCDFLGGLSEVLVLEEGEPFLFLHLQALAHREQVPVRVVAPEGMMQRRPRFFDEADLDAAIRRFAGPADREAAEPPPGYDLALAQRRIRDLLPPTLDDQGELGEEPWPLYFARLKNKRPRFSRADPRLHLLTLLRHLPRPSLIVAGPGPAGDLGGPQRLIDVQLHGGAAAPVAGALSRAQAVVGLVEEAKGRPLSVALLDGSAGPGSQHLEQLGVLDNALSRRDVLHVLILPQEHEGEGEARVAEGLLPQLRAAGVDVVMADLHDGEAVARAVAYTAHRQGPRALLCYGQKGEPGTSGTSGLWPGADGL